VTAFDLGARIHIVGTSGSGKTTLARSLAEGLGLPHVELDALHWAPGWTERPNDEYRALLREATAGAGWVADGNYGSLGTREILWPIATSIVWLDFSRAAVMAQVTQRTFTRWLSQEPLWHGNRERLGTTLFTRESILWWAWKTHGPNRALYEKLLAEPPCQVLRLRDRAEVAALLQQVSQPTL
jgi:adenylate kinase family enzyme